MLSNVPLFGFGDVALIANPTNDVPALEAESSTNWIWPLPCMVSESGVMDHAGGAPLTPSVNSTVILGISHHRVLVQLLDHGHGDLSFRMDGFPRAEAERRPLETPGDDTRSHEDLPMSFSA